MAERKNFLDREKEKRDGENYLPYSIALIPGLTALEQDALVKDIAEGLVKRNLVSKYEDPERPENLFSAVSQRKVADQIEDYIHRLPEPMQDSWILSALGDRDPVFYNEEEKARHGVSKSVAGFYDPKVNTVFIDENRFLSDPSIIIHENAHKMNHDINREHPYYKDVWEGIVPDRMVGINLGKTLSKEMPNSFMTPKGAMDRQELVDELSRISKSGENGDRDAFTFYGKTLAESGMKYTPFDSKDYLDSKKREKRWDFAEKRGKVIDDFFNLDPGMYGRSHENDLRGHVTDGHPREYQKKHLKNAWNQERALYDAALVDRDFKYDVAPYAALSTESAAELAELLATEGGEEYVKQKHPVTYETMMNEYRNDPRKSKPKEELRPWRLYSHESGDNVYKVRGEPAAYDPNAERRFLRVPTAYGEYVYSDDYFDGRKDAVRRGKDYVEYRDLDGNWRRFYPDEMKGVKENRMIGTKEWAKLLGKKLLKGAK